MKTWLLFIFLFVSNHLGAQNFEYNIKINDISFSGDSIINIVDDSTWKTFTAPQWLKDSLSLPIGYVSGSRMELSARLNFNCSINAPDSVWIRAFGDHSYNFPIRKSALISSGTLPGHYYIQYPLTKCDKKFDSLKVDFIDKLQLSWEASMDGVNWFSADTSAHRVYVTKSKPMASNTYFNYYYTVIDLSCRNAKGAGSDSAIISHCWSEFTDQITLNYKGDSLFYYKTFNTPHTSVAALLRYRNAECFSFAQLFIAMLKIQGISITNNYIELYIRPTGSFCVTGSPASMGYISTFMVKGWKFITKSDSAVCPNYPYTNTCDPFTYSKTGKYVWGKEDVQDAPGLAGQCNPNPASLFQRHQVVKIGGIYYDPSYGVTYTSLSDFRTKAIDGWAVYSTTAYRMTNNVLAAEILELIKTW